MAHMEIRGLPLAWAPVERDGHAAGRALLRALYAEAVGGEMPEIRTGPWGKPDFAAGDWHFSISHTQRHAFCVLSRRAEELTRPVSPALPPRVLSPGELAQYWSAEDRQRAFLTFWVLKEALAKCTGRGLTRQLNQTNFSLNDSRVFHLGGCIAAIVQEDDDAF